MEMNADTKQVQLLRRSKLLRGAPKPPTPSNDSGFFARTLSDSNGTGADVCQSCRLRVAKEQGLSSEGAGERSESDENHVRSFPSMLHRLASSYTDFLLSSRNRR